GRASTAKVHNRSAPQVHVEKPAFDAVLARNPIDSGLGADLGEEVSEVVGPVRPAGLLADNINSVLFWGLVEHLPERREERDLDRAVGAVAGLLRADLHYSPPALPAVHFENVAFSLAKIRAHSDG